MKAKTFEIRDDGTLIPAMAVKLEPDCEADRFIIARGGYTEDPTKQAKYILLVQLSSSKTTCDPHMWDRGRTMREAHLHIEKYFDSLDSGAVIDVEFILGETTVPKVSGL